jgi:hypothetical protein
MKYQKNQLIHVYPNQRNSSGLGNCCSCLDNRVTGMAFYEIFYISIRNYRDFGSYEYFRENSDGEKVDDTIWIRYCWFMETIVKKRR